MSVFKAVISMLIIPAEPLVVKWNLFFLLFLEFLGRRTVREIFFLFFLYSVARCLVYFGITNTQLNWAAKLADSSQGFQAVMKKNIILLLLMTGMSAAAFAVPAAPNEAMATGTVVEYSISSLPGPGPVPGPGLYKIVVKVDAVEDRGDAPNFLKGREGDEITFWSRNRLDPGLFGKKVKALVEYRGDERGGLFWLKRVKIMQ